ncbi:hypothetical protein SAURM35S_07364 [Streptomyces aurantiogriseus]
MSLSPSAGPGTPDALDGPGTFASPDEALAALTDPAAPCLIGVRHHAPSLAAAVPVLLDEAKPDVLLVELPAEMQEWLPWLGHEETRAPVALAAAPGDGSGGAGPAFYPFADFSPELAAVRWADRRGVPVIACDLPLADRAWGEGRRVSAEGGGGPGLAAALRAGLTGRPGDDLWDRLVEATAPGSPPEALRRAALLTGWALRKDAAASGGVPELDLRREQWMRARLAEATAQGERAAVVVGAFHAPALVGRHTKEEAEAATEASRPAWTTSLIPYTYALLQHAGGLPEARLAALRPLVRRLVDALTRQLATRLRPALHGTALPRPSRRPGGGLDLPRTLRANLATARRGPDGTVQVIPERPVFRTRARRAADWRLILVTDVSGSMEASTVWAALTASVLAGVPTLSTHFLAFSTEVIDLTGHVEDPLSLLLEVSVGGGTHIAAGLRHARELVTVPSRTLVVVVSDFEEGYPLGGLLAEVRALVGAGCHVLGCASLDDTGRPRYSTGVAGQLVAAGMPVAALSPLELARWVGEKIA